MKVSGNAGGRWGLVAFPNTKSFKQVLVITTSAEDVKISSSSIRFLLYPSDFSSFNSSSSLIVSEIANAQLIDLTPMHLVTQAAEHLITSDIEACVLSFPLTYEYTRDAQESSPTSHIMPLPTLSLHFLYLHFDRINVHTVSLPIIIRTSNLLPRLC